MKKLVFGIQGGEGSFNQEALGIYMENNDISDYEMRFLYTTEVVLKALENHEIDFGLFAIHNSAGGIVDESIKAMARHRFEIKSNFSILIRHFLMKRRDVDLSEISKIMAHPQVLKQCRLTLALKYRGFELISGERDLIDTACAAKNLAMRNVDKNIAVLGPKSLSELYDLEIIDTDLQDSRDNMTSFLVVRAV